MQNPKNQSANVNARQTQLGFITSIITGIMMIVAEIILLVTTPQPIANLLDVRVVTIGIVLSCFVSAWLTRRGRMVWGLTLILVALYAAVLAVVFSLSGVGLASGVVIVVLTFGITSALFPPTWARRMMAVAVTMTFVFAGMDLFDFPPRTPNGTPVVAWTITALFMLVFGFLVYRQFGSYSLRTKLLVVMVGTTIIVSAVLTILGINATSQALTQSVGQQLYGDASAHGLQVADLILNQIDLLTTLSLNELLQNAVRQHNFEYTNTDPQAIAAEIGQRDQQWISAANDDPFIQEHLTSPVALDLQEFQATFTNHVEVFITDRYGALIAATNRTSDYNQADEAWWQAAYADGNGTVYLSKSPEYDASTGQFSLLVALPIYERQTKELIGILRTTYVLNNIQSILMTTGVGSTGEADIVFPGEQPGHIHNGQYEVMGAESWQLVSSMADQKYTQEVYEGIPRILGISQVHSASGQTKVDGLGWLIILHQDAAEALAPVDQQTRATTIISVLITLMASGAAAGLAQVLVVPISRLTAVAEKVSAGDYAARAEVQSEDEIGRLATSFNTMTSQLQSTLQGLEQRVADRTRALETATEVSRRISTILDQRQLVSEVVEQVRSSFDYYHTHIYLFDEQKENLLMAGGTGEVGQTMLESGHAVPKGRGLVGRAASTNLPVLVPDVTKVDGWLPNPLLPGTRAEAAVPIAIGENILGVLDVQDDAVNGLSETDIALLQAIAGQVAIALQNARAYQQAQHQADREALIGNIAQQIQSTTTMEDALKVAAREVGRALGTTVGVQLKRPADGAKN
jgi:putative methionine-R-sulfoxide reductase with GAF domain